MDFDNNIEENDYKCKESELIQPQTLFETLKDTSKLLIEKNYKTLIYIKMFNNYFGKIEKSHIARFPYIYVPPSEVEALKINWKCKKAINLNYKDDTNKLGISATLSQ